jgi:LacI family transcriptional regulator
LGITTKDLARICGVSLGTIDRAFRNRPGIKAETRERIMAAARAYDYKPNLIAKNLRQGRTFEIGLVVHDLENEFFAQLVNEIQEIVWAKQYYLQLAVSRRDADRERTGLEHMSGRNVDGIILFSVCRGAEFDEFLRKLNRPIVTIANKISGSWPFVGLSDRRVMRELTETVIAKGYERLVFVGPLRRFAASANLYQIEERYAGFLEACGGNPLVDHLLWAGGDYLEELRSFEIGKRRTAILCCSDIFALEILNDLQGRGLSVPRDLGLMGFDSINALKYVKPSLSTVVYPIRQMGDMAFSLLTDERRDGDDAPQIELEPKITWGNSI